MTATSLNAAVVLPEVQALLTTTLRDGECTIAEVTALPVHPTVAMLLWRERRDLRTGTVCRELSDEGKTIALAIGSSASRARAHTLSLVKPAKPAERVTIGADQWDYHPDTADQTIDVVLHPGVPEAAWTKGYAMYCDWKIVALAASSYEDVAVAALAIGLELEGA